MGEGKRVNRVEYIPGTNQIVIYTNGNRQLTFDVDDILESNTEITANFIIGDGVNPISTGIQGDIEIPCPCTLTAVKILADQNGAIVVDLWKDSFTNFPPTVDDKITASSKPTISGVNKYEDTTLASWIKTFSEGDIIRVNVDSASTITRCTLVLKLTRR